MNEARGTSKGKQSGICGQSSVTRWPVVIRIPVGCSAGFEMSADQVRRDHMQAMFRGRR